MNSKRELLELAAKAAGYTFDGAVLKNPSSEFEYDGWNPIECDGDALRLAVKLGIQITPGIYNKNEFSAFKAAGGEAHEFCNDAQDHYAAVRLAIVRVAAEIGRNMK